MVEAKDQLQGDLYSKLIDNYAQIGSKKEAVRLSFRWLSQDSLAFHSPAI